MDWMNIHIPTALRSPEYVGSSPTERGTWLSVLAYACEIECGGRLPGAAAWKDRQWQQACGVTLREIKSAYRLLRADGDDLLVNGYPLASEKQVVEGRKNAKAGAMARWGKRDALGHAPRHEGMWSKSVHTAMPSDDAKGEGEGEGEGKGEGDAGKPAAHAPPPDQQIDDIMKTDQATAARIASEPVVVVYSWQDWRREHPRVGIARTGEDGDADAWRDLWKTYGRECFDGMYRVVLDGIIEGKKVWYSQAAEWLAKNTKDEA
jgi:hypothetical protein